MHRGVATFTLDTGKCPKWLFDRMVRLGRSINEVLIDEFGPDEFIKRISDPVWFQSLGTVLAFDWNASGLTTILTAALKESIRGEEERLGVFICGGKGKTSRKTPDQIYEWGNRLGLAEGDTANLSYNSRMAAKVDSALVQDGYQLYHHSFFFSRNGAWAVVQQGMNERTSTARRYHWYSESVHDLVREPHSGISSEAFNASMLNLVARESDNARNVSTELVQSSFPAIKKDIEILRRHSTPVSRMASVRHGSGQLTLLELSPHEFRYHPVVEENFWYSKYLEKILQKLAYEKPKNYESLLATEGVGAKTIRALALVAEIIYGARPSYKDPARYSFAHGGKDGTPYPVDRKTYDRTIALLREAIQKSQATPKEKDGAMGRITQLSF